MMIIIIIIIIVFRIQVTINYIIWRIVTYVLAEKYMN